MATSDRWTRRQFLKAASVVSSLGILTSESPSPHCDHPPEITRIRLTATPAICLAPQYVAETLLKAEGFSDVQYVKLENPAPNRAVASGEADISMDAVWGFMSRIDAGDPVTVLAGVHLGCYQLIASDQIQSIRDLKGKTVPVFQLGDPQPSISIKHVLSSMLAYVGRDP